MMVLKSMRTCGSRTAGPSWRNKTASIRNFPKNSRTTCWSTRPSDGSLICIQRGVSGYCLSDWSTDKPEQNRRIADYNNRERGMYKAQEEAMVNGSMFGWDTPAADPRNYLEGRPPQMGGPSMWSPFLPYI